MILGKLFGFPVEEGLYETAYGILKNEYGLVDGHGESSTGNYRVLVWEDAKGIGRFVVHLRGNYEWNLPGDGKLYDVFDFRYWDAPWMFDKEVFSEDPMKEPLQRIHSLSENRFDTNHMFCEMSIEELEKIHKTQK